MSYDLPINLIRQWCFCPRIPYYRALLNLSVNEPLWSQQGSKHHHREQQLFKRRNLSRFNLEQGTQHHQISLQHDHLNIHGIADLLIETDEAVFLVEHKRSEHVTLGHQLQLTAYALAAEFTFHKPCHMGFLLLHPKKVVTIPITPELRTKTIEAVQAIRDMLNRAHKPYSSATPHQCSQCEYLNYCNDRAV